MKENRSFVSSPLLLCLAAAFGICSALPASGSEIGAQHVRTSERIYADQDAAAAKSRKLAGEGNYVEAIKILKDDVISPLEMEASEVDSWKARQRLAEFREELRRMQLTYGNLKLRASENALAEEKYNEAIAYANEALLITELLRERAMGMISAANGRKNALARQQKASVQETDPDIEKREKQIKRLLAEGWTFFRNGLYDNAFERVEAVYALNPYNADAAYLASRIFRKFYEIGYRRRQSDRQAQMAYEAWQWVEPTFPMPQQQDESSSSTGLIKQGSDSAIQLKLDQIVFPVVSFNETDLEAVVNYLNDNKDYDKERVGVPISLIRVNEEAPKAKKDELASGTAGGIDGIAGDSLDGDSVAEDDFNDDNSGDKNSEAGADEVYVTLNLKNVTLRQALDYICFLTDYSYVVRNDRVIFGSPDQRMLVKNYDLVNTVKMMVVGKQMPTSTSAPESATAPAPAGDEMSDDLGLGDDDLGLDGDDLAAEGAKDAPAAEGAADTAAAPAAPVVNDAELTPELLKKFFELYGIEFPKNSSISFFRGRLSMNNTEEQHMRMEMLLADINIESPMIEVEVKSIELSESDMEELGFNWALSGIEGDKWQVYKGENTTSTGENAMLKMLDSMLSGVDSQLIGNLNIFPDLFGSFKPFGIDESFNLTLTINALDRSDRTEQISAPRVLVANNKTATVKMTKSYFFPEEWEELEFETEELGDNGAIQIDVTPPRPEFADDPTDIGTIFTVTPTIIGKDTIRLHLIPTITAYTGKDEHQAVIREQSRPNANAKWEAPVDTVYSVWQPVIATRKLDVWVDLYHGETLVIGGLSDSSSQRRLDKIPILADIPLIGRLFQNQSETSIRRNMLIFVTARMIGNDGIPRARKEGTGNNGVPRLMR